jgi:hypothetical protein
MRLHDMKLFNLGDKKATEDFTAKEIARGMKEGTNVADLQQALQDSKSGRSTDTTDMVRALGGGSARELVDGGSDVTETPNAWGDL